MCCVRCSSYPTRTHQGSIEVDRLYPSDVWEVTREGYTLLMLAAMHNRVELVRDLVNMPNCPLDYRQMKVSPQPSVCSVHMHTVTRVHVRMSTRALTHTHTHTHTHNATIQHLQQSASHALTHTYNHTHTPTHTHTHTHTHTMHICTIRNNLHHMHTLTHTDLKLWFGGLDVPQWKYGSECSDSHPEISRGHRLLPEDSLSFCRRKRTCMLPQDNARVSSLIVQKFQKITLKDREYS